GRSCALTSPDFIGSAPRMDELVTALRIALCGGAGVLAACGQKDGPGDTGSSSNPRPPKTISSEAYVKAEGGVILRTGPAHCEPHFSGEACTGTEANLTCRTDADCKARPHGSCRSYAAVPAATSRVESPSSCGCAYQC